MTQATPGIAARARDGYAWTRRWIIPKKKSPETARRRPRGPAASPNTVVTLLTDEDLHLYNEGTHFRVYEKLGAHRIAEDGAEGCAFAVFAPNAQGVSVIGDWNGWDKASHPLRPRAQSGIWEGFIPGVGAGAVYKYHVVSRHNGYRVDKADPFAFAGELPPRTGSIVVDLDFDWGDRAWMESRKERHSPQAPISIYEVHLGSWRRPWDSDRFLTYREIAPQLADYAREMGFTHVEFLPVMEHPFYGSWGYQDGLFRADEPVRFSGRLPVPDRHSPPEADRSDPGLGAVPFPFRRAWPRVLRRDLPLRARGPATGIPSRVEKLRLQLRAQRSPQLSSFQRRVLAREVPRRRPARGCGCVDAASRLLAQDRRVGPQRLRRKREPRGDLAPAAVERLRSHHAPRRSDDRRGIHGVADGLASHARGGPGFRHEVGHGLDERHPQLHAPRSHSPQVPPHGADVPGDVRLLGELPAPSVARRGRAHEGVAPDEDAGRRLAQVRQPAPSPRLQGRRAGQKAPLNGRRIRAVGRVGPRFVSPVAPAGISGPRRREALDGGCESPLHGRARAPRARLRSLRVRVDRLQRLGRLDAHDRTPGRHTRGDPHRGLELHACAALPVPRRRALRRLLARDRQQRRGRLRGKRVGKPGRRPRRGDCGTRAAVQPEPDSAALGCSLPEGRSFRCPFEESG